MVSTTWKTILAPGYEKVIFQSEFGKHAFGEVGSGFD
jgi:hypothetical protein